ncbi:AAA family ATPase [Streptomyces nogalater]
MHSRGDSDPGTVLNFASRDGRERIRLAALPYVHPNRYLHLFPGFGTTEGPTRPVCAPCRTGCSRDCATAMPRTGTCCCSPPTSTWPAPYPRRANACGRHASPTPPTPPPCRPSPTARWVTSTSRSRWGPAGWPLRRQPLQMDFGESEETKSVTVVEAGPGRRTLITPRTLHAGRRLARFHGTLEELRADADQYSGVYLKAVIRSDEPIPRLGDKVTELVPQATVVSIEEDCAATRTSALTSADAADDGTVDLTAAFGGYLADRGTPGRAPTRWWPPSPASSPRRSPRCPAPRRATPHRGPRHPGRHRRQPNGDGMKIVSLTFSGLRSYPGTCGPLDFTGKNLVGILGDTGAGKTSLLEAITAALYGRCSWTDRAAQLRADDSATMMIDLVFAVDGRQWRVHRVFHETRPTQARLTGPDNKNIDGVRAVDEAIRNLIGIDYATFHSSVLIPQGRFGELLNANDAERTRILKSIFGVEELHRVRQLALDATSHLNELLHQAERENDRLHEDPRAQAANARERRDKALGDAADLDGRRSQLRRLRTEAARAKDHARLSAGAAAALRERRISDYQPTTEAVQQAQAELQRLEGENAAAETTAQADLETVTALQNEAASAGLAAAALAAAAQVLSDVPRRLATLEEEESAHAQLLADLKDEEEALARRAADLDEEDRRADALRSRVRDAEDEAADASEALQMLTDAIRAGIEAAGTLAQQRAAQAATDHKLTALLQAPPADTPDVARTELRRAQGILEDIRRREAAHTAGSGLAAGDGCPVCAQPLPRDYRPPQPQDADALAHAETAVEAASAALTAAEREHTRHTHEVELLQTALIEHQREVQQAADRLQAALPRCTRTLCDWQPRRLTPSRQRMPRRWRTPPRPHSPPSPTPPHRRTTGRRRCTLCSASPATGSRSCRRRSPPVEPS